MDTFDQGKPLREARADMDDAITACGHFADLIEKRVDEVVDNGTGGDFVTTIVHEPIGVVGAITPWNYPLLMAMWKVRCYQCTITCRHVHVNLLHNVEC